MIHIKTNVATSVVIALVVATNFASIMIAKVNANEEHHTYVEGAVGRRMDNAIEKLNYQLKIKALEKELKNCKNK